MIKKTIYGFGLALTLCVFFYGCKTGGFSLEMPGMESQIIAGSLSEMPDDAARIVSAASSLMTGNPSSSTVKFSHATAKGILDGRVTETGFTLTVARLYRYDTLPDASSRKIMAVLEFKNSLGRRSQGEINVSYQIEASGITVLQASSKAIFDTVPETICFVLPASKMPCTQKTLPKTFETLYRQVAKEAVKLGDSHVTGVEEDWGMVIFFMDRISPSAQIKLLISASDSGFGGYSETSRYIDYNGWRVGFTAGRFALIDQDSENTLYLKAVYTPGKEAGFFKTPTTTGLYSLKSYQ